MNTSVKTFIVGESVWWHNKDNNKKAQVNIISYDGINRYTVEITPKNYKDYVYSHHRVNGDDLSHYENDIPNIVQSKNWFKSAYAAITKAGGDPQSVLDRIPDSVIDTLMKNNLYLEYRK